MVSASMLVTVAQVSLLLAVVDYTTTATATSTPGTRILPNVTVSYIDQALGNVGTLRYFTHIEYRHRRESLISTYDISKIFKKKKMKSKNDTAPRPSASSLQSSIRDAETTSASGALGTRGITAQLNTVATERVIGDGNEINTTQAAGNRSNVVPTNIRITSINQPVQRPRPAGAQPEGNMVWPVKHAVVVEGDIVLGGLIMVHARGRSESAACGPVVAQGGVQALEAVLFALDTARALGLEPPHVRLGARLLDDCDNDAYGLEMALDFIKGSISNIEDAEYACARETSAGVISGVIGAASSVTSVQVANLLRLFKIPQISYFSTSPELSNKARFEYFTRTIPSDLHQVRAMVEIVKALGWRYVSVVYEESNYGIKAFEELETMLDRNEICIAVKERLVKESGEVDEHAYDAVVARLLSRPRARGVIVFASEQEVAGVMAAVRRAGPSTERAFAWVGCDGWSARSLVSEGNERVVEGTISVQPQANPVRGFQQYFLNLTVENNRRNPWFVEFWEAQFQCRYPGGARTPHNAHLRRRCSGAERLSAENTRFEPQLQFVADAVLAFAHAVRAMHRAECGGRPGVCAAMRPGSASGAILLRYLREVRFTGLSGDEFQFDRNGDGPPRYDILHYKQTAPGAFRWLHVGRYLRGRLQLRLDEIQFKWDEPRVPESACSAECALGQAKQYVEGERCCWRCFNCTRYEVRGRETTSCVSCPPGTLPDAARAHCEPVPELYLRPDSAWAIAAMVFSSFGIMLTS